MSFFNYDEDNSIQLRLNRVKANEIWLKNDETDEYQKVGFDGPIELPYYLKPNAIKIDGETTNVNVDKDSVDVNNLGNTIGTSLQYNQLVFGDAAGNSVLTKPGVDTVSRLQTLETATALTNANGTLPVVYNPTTKAFNQSRNIQLISADGNTRTNITTAGFSSNMPNTPARSFAAGISSGVTHNEVNYRMYAAALATGIVHRNLTTNKGTVAKEDSFTVGDMSNDAISATGNYGKLSETALSFKDAIGTVSLNRAGVDTVSRLQTAENAVALANSTGTLPIVYNPATKAFNQSSAIALLSADGVYRTNITPTSFRISLPNDTTRYCTIDNGLGLVNENPNYRLYSSANSTGIILRNKITNEGTVAKEDSYTVGSMTSDAISTTADYSKLGKSSLTFKDSSGTLVLNKDDVAVTNKLKALTTAATGANSKMLIYDTATSAFNYTDLASAGALPSYLKDTFIRMDATTSGYINIEAGDTNNAQITVGNIGGTYPSSVRVLSTGVRFGISGTPNAVILDSSDVSKLKRLVDNQAVYGGSVVAADFPIYDIAANTTTSTPACRRYIMSAGETLVLSSTGSASSSIKFNIYYVLNLNQGVNAVYSGCVTPGVRNNVGELRITRYESTQNQVPAGSIAFAIINTTKSTSDYFNGQIAIKVESSDYTTLGTRGYTNLPV